MPGDPLWSNVKLLASFNGSYTDTSSFGRTLTPTDYFGVVPDFKFGSGGFGSYAPTTAVLQTPSTTNLAIGSGQFTIECWARVIGAWPADGISHVLVAKWGASATDWIFCFDNNLGSGFSLYQGSNFAWHVGSVNPTDENWHHYAVDRDASNVIRLYIDGVVKASFTSSASITNTSTQALSIGNQGSTSATNNWPGIIDEVRITVGVARYGGAFTPPSSAFPVGSGSDSSWASVHLLASFDGNLTDSSADNRTLTLSPTATSVVALDGSTFNFGSGSLSIPGKYQGGVQTPNSSTLAIGTNLFTIECWAKVNGTFPSDGLGHSLLDQWGPNTDWWFGFDKSLNSGMAFYVNGAFTFKDGAVYPTDTAWHHYCAERGTGNTFRLYIDGAVALSSTGFTTSITNNGILAIGAQTKTNTDTTWPGWIDEVRLTIGAARYNGAFTPSGPFPVGPVTAVPSGFFFGS